MRSIISLSVAAVLLGFGAFTGTTPASAAPKQNDLGAAPTAIGGASCPNARLCAFAGRGSIFRTKGVAAITHPSVGLYCVRPSVRLGAYVPVVSVDWSTSLGDGSLVQWRSSGIGCPTGNVTIMTFSNGDSSTDFTLSDLVVFTLLVP
jgi:hypothetical protein